MNGKKKSSLDINNKKLKMSKPSEEMIKVITEHFLPEIDPNAYKLIKIRELIEEPDNPTEEELLHWLLFKDGYYHQKLMEIMTFDSKR